MKQLKTILIGALMLVFSLACSLNPVIIVTPVPGGTGGNSNSGSGGGRAPDGEQGQVTRVVDGDTIDVRLNDGETIRVRYLGMNTTETNRGESCSQDGKQANAALVDGQRVTLVADRDPEDQYGRALRYVYVGDLFVNAELVRQGWAEAVMYEPNDRHWEQLIEIEQQAERANRGCHGMNDIFDDGSYRR